MIQELLNVVRTVAVAAFPGAGDALAAADAVLDLAKSIRPTLATDDRFALDVELDALIARMNAAVDQAVSDLKG